MVDLSARTESDNHGAGEDLRACREVRGQRESREEDRVESRVSVAALGGMSKKESDGGRVDREHAAREEGECERILRRTGTVSLEIWL